MDAAAQCLKPLPEQVDGVADLLLAEGLLQHHVPVFFKVLHPLFFLAGVEEVTLFLHPID